MKTYRIASVRDLLDVPMEKREQCFRELEYALALVELAGPEAVAALLHIDWTDDNNASVDLQTDTGESILRLEVTKT